GGPWVQMAGGQGREDVGVALGEVHLEGDHGRGTAGRQREHRDQMGAAHLERVDDGITRAHVVAGTGGLLVDTLAVQRVTGLEAGGVGAIVGLPGRTGGRGQVGDHRATDTARALHVRTPSRPLISNLRSRVVDRTRVRNRLRRAAANPGEIGTDSRTRTRDTAILGPHPGPRRRRAGPPLPRGLGGTHDCPCRHATARDHGRRRAGGDRRGRGSAVDTGAVGVVVRRRRLRRPPLPGPWFGLTPLHHLSLIVLAALGIGDQRPHGSRRTARLAFLILGGLADPMHLIAFVVVVLAAERWYSGAEQGLRPRTRRGGPLPLRRAVGPVGGRGRPEGTGPGRPWGAPIFRAPRRASSPRSRGRARARARSSRG